MGAEGNQMRYRYYRREALRMLRLRRASGHERSKTYWTEKAILCLRAAAAWRRQVTT